MELLFVERISAYQSHSSIVNIHNNPLNILFSGLLPIVLFIVPEVDQISNLFKIGS